MASVSRVQLSRENRYNCVNEQYSAAMNSHYKTLPLTLGATGVVVASLSKPQFATRIVEGAKSVFKTVADKISKNKIGESVVNELKNAYHATAKFSKENPNVVKVIAAVAVPLFMLESLRQMNLAFKQGKIQQKYEDKEVIDNTLYILSKAAE